MLTVNDGSKNVSMNTIGVKGSRVKKLTIGRDVSRDRHLGWATRSTTSDVDLSARDEPLRGTCNMETGLFNTDEVLARGCGSGDGSGQLVEVEIDKVERVEGSTPLSNLSTVKVSIK
jgi:hypothetical protein